MIDGVGGERPYNPERTGLYTVDELMDGYSPETPLDSLDQRIGRFYTAAGGREPTDDDEALAQALHDNRIQRALEDLVRTPEFDARNIVGIMGSAAAKRTDADYAETARLAWMLARDGMVVATGGGLGMMEAANLGAFLSGHDHVDIVENALEILRDVPDGYKGNERAYVETARKVIQEFGPGNHGIAIPTWAYSDEPLSQFATRIAKYFANSIREDGLLAIAIRGVVFTRGRAGTLQEIFQDAAQNTYWAFRSRSPMVFLDRGFWMEEVPAVPAVLASARNAGWADLVAVVDSAPEAAETLGRLHPQFQADERPLGRTEATVSVQRTIEPIDS